MFFLVILRRLTEKPNDIFTVNTSIIAKPVRYSQRVQDADKISSYTNIQV